MRIAASTGMLTSAGFQSLPDAEHFRRLGALGFEWLDVSDIWSPLGRMSPDEAAVLRDAIGESGMKVAGVSIIGYTPHYLAAHPGAFREDAVRALDNATILGTDIVSVGLHEGPKGGIASGARPPWLTQGGPPARSPGHMSRAAEAVQVIADLAAERGQSIHLEMNESSVLDTGAGCVEIIQRAARPNVRLNPDLANIIRAPWPLREDWRTTLRTVAPYIEYWHVKNCHRIELEDGRAASTHSGLAEGHIDYSLAVRIAREAGFDGVLVVEHYGGDVLWFGRAAFEYLSEVIADPQDCGLRVNGDFTAQDGGS